MRPRIALAVLAAALMPGLSVAAPGQHLVPPAPVRPAVHLVDQTYEAAADPVDFLFQLGLLEGHLMIGHELLQAGKTGLAMPHFGHPVRELYDDIADYLKANKVPPFEADLIRLEAAVAKAPKAAETEALFQSVIATVHRARATTPEALRDAIPAMIRICSDTLDTASGEFGEAIVRGRVEQLVEYHDSRGFIAFVTAETERLAGLAKTQADQALVASFRTILAKAQWIVAPLLPDPAPRASVTQYRAIAAEAAALAKR